MNLLGQAELGVIRLFALLSERFGQRFAKMLTEFHIGKIVEPY